MFEYLKNRFLFLFLKMNLIFFNYFMVIRNFVFNHIDNIYFVYYLPNNDIDSNVSNITLNYYTQIGLSKYKKGIFYFIINNKNGTDHVAYNGLITDINNYKPVEGVTIKRKNILLLNNDVPLKKDLNIFNNYLINCENYKDTYVKDLKTVVKLFGLKCTHVTISQSFPKLYREKLDVNSININDIFF